MRYYEVDLDGYKAKLPVMKLPSGISICFFNLHGHSELTEHCGKKLAKLIPECDALITAESKGLQLTHVIARELNQPRYAVARKSKKLYMQDGLDIVIDSSITTGKEQHLYLSQDDAELIKGKKVVIVDDVISTGASLSGLEKIVELAGGTVVGKAFVLAEGEAKDRKDVIYLNSIPIITD